MKLISESAFGVMTVWAEARGEPFNGKQAVAEVIQRRANRHFFSDGTVAGTVLRPSQFSCWMSTDPNFRAMLRIDASDPVVADCQRAWDAASIGIAIVPGALLYANLNILPVPPSWVAASELIELIGAHSFFKPK
jgi:N-acetylmuramoyl-L-alanine amidase